MANQKIKQKALDTFDNMTEIIRNEMIAKGEYVSQEVYGDEGAICGGRKYCLFGAAYVGYGIRPKMGSRWKVYVPGLPGDGSWITAEARKRFLRNRPALKLVQDALNEAADKRLKRLGIPFDRDDYEEGLGLDWFENSAERLFENHNPGRTALLGLVRDARKIVEAR